MTTMEAQKLWDNIKIMKKLFIATDLEVWYGSIMKLWDTTKSNFLQAAPPYRNF